MYRLQKCLCLLWSPQGTWELTSHFDVHCSFQGTHRNYLEPNSLEPQDFETNAWPLLCLWTILKHLSVQWNARLDEAQVGIKIAERNINNLRYADDTTLMAESEELKRLLMKVKESGKPGLKLNIQKTKIMASGPITSWANRWGNNGNSDRLYLKSQQIVTAAMKLKGACSLEEKLWPT